MSQFGYIDIENDEIQKYMDDLKESKREKVCRILPRGRFGLGRDGWVHYDGLICSNKMGGQQTGVAARWCTNCKLKRKGK